MRHIATREAAAVYDRVASITGVKLDDLLSDRKAAPICRGRWIVMRTLRDMGGSLPEIGRVMQMHHTSVLTGLSRFEEALDEEPLFARWVQRVRTQ